MKIIRPQSINSVTLLSSSIAESDYAAWAVGTTYARATRVIFVPTAATVTVTSAAPAVVTWPSAHGFAENTPVMFTNSGGALPAGITAGVVYYVRLHNALPTTTFQLSLKKSGAAINTTTAGTGTTTCTPQVHRVYESLQAGNVGKQPLISPTWWVLISSTNRWRMFDDSVATQSTAPTSMTMVLQGAGSNDAVQLMNVSADTVKLVLSDAAVEVAFTVTVLTDLINRTAHGLVAGDAITLRTTGTIPAGLVALTTAYYVLAAGLTANAFSVSLTALGAVVDITDVGTGIHYFAVVVSNANDSLENPTGLKAWDVSTGFYASKSLSVAAQVPNSTALVISPDGSKMYMPSSSAGLVYQYSLGTAWDVSTGSYASKSLSVAAQITALTGVAFSSDGTKMYALEDAVDKVYQYSLSTAWDVSTGSYASKLLSVIAQESSVKSLAFSSDGTKMYVLGTWTDKVYQYSLSTAWDVSTGSYASKSLSVGAQENTSTGLAFSSDGARMYVLGTGNNTVYQYKIGEYIFASDFSKTNFPVYNNSRLIITLTATNVLCGEIVFGRTLDLGGTQTGARVGIRDYSVKKQDDWGNLTIVERAYSKRASFRVLVDNRYIDYFQKVLADYRATPVVWIGAEAYTSTHLFGFFSDFDIEIAYPAWSLCSIEIEGLV